MKKANSIPSRRIDIRLLPILGIMYSISLIDRTNLGLALVAGMQEDLGLAVGNRYTVIVMVFFVAYMLVCGDQNLMYNSGTFTNLPFSLFEIPSVRCRNQELTAWLIEISEPCPPKSRPRKLALLLRRWIWCCADRYGLHEKLGWDGCLSSFAWSFGGWVSTR